MYITKTLSSYRNFLLHQLNKKIANVNASLLRLQITWVKGVVGISNEVRGFSKSSCLRSMRLIRSPVRWERANFSTFQVLDT